MFSEFFPTTLISDVVLNSLIESHFLVTLYILFDILSFPFQKKIKLKDKLYLGDIIISYNFINKPKSLNTKLFREKLTKIFIHGFLHLLGFNHIKDKDYKKMLKEEDQIYKSVISKLN